MIVIFYIFISIIGTVLFFSAIARHKKISIYQTVNKRNINNDNKSKNAGTKKTSHEIVKFIKISPILLDANKTTLLALIIFSFVSSIIVFLLGIEINEEKLVTLLAIIITFSLLLPKIFIKNILASRTRTMLHTLPFFIDMVAACVQSGMTLESSLDYTAKHFYKINKDMASLMNMIMRRAEINGLVSAVKELNQQIPMMEIKMFCSAINYSVSFGSSIYEQLIKLSHDIREMQFLIIEEKIGKLSTKIIFPLFLFILIPFIAIVMAPSIIGILSFGDII